MDHDQLLFDLRNAPSLKLLRRDNAALILRFLHRAFKSAHAASVPLNDLIDQLDVYLELLGDDHPGLYPLSAASYLKQRYAYVCDVLRQTTGGA
jgi:hypothetical protein